MAFIGPFYKDLPHCNVHPYPQALMVYKEDKVHFNKIIKSVTFTVRGPFEGSVREMFSKTHPPAFPDQCKHEDCRQGCVPTTQLPRLPPAQVE